ncbi:MAG TPA: hypothetical protein VEU62_22795 [Bryobacterales bacterium]|nr:hypothetical protein [Bryobacterales bacterium]
MACFVALLLALLGAASAAGQFHDLAATDDGSVLYFSSPLRQRGADQFPHDKIFRLGSDGIQLIAQREYQPTAGPNYSNFYRLIESNVSGDGAILSYVAQRDCIGGSSCLFVERNETTLVRPPQGSPVTTFTGRGWLSRNGRYALNFGFVVLRLAATLIDLSTGERIPVPSSGAFVTGRQILTSDGAVLLLDPQAMLLWTRTGGTRRIPAAAAPQSAAINDQGTWLVYETQVTSELRSVDLASGRDTLLATGSPDPYQPFLRNDGRVVSYLASPDRVAPKQVFVINSDGTGRRQLTQLAEGASEAVLSGDGSVAYAVSGAGRLLRIDVAAGAAQEIIPRTPVIHYVAGAPVPGSLNWIYGTGLSEKSALGQPPLPTSLGDLQVTLGGAPLPLLLVSPGEIRYQIPFEAPLTDAVLAVSPSASPFEQAPMHLSLSAQMARTVQFGREVPLIPGATTLDVVAHQNFDSLVDSSNEAQPGEIVHAYMTGLGAVNPPVATGQPSPANPPASVVGPFACGYLYEGASFPARLWFAGLAAGMIGIYQVSVQVPDLPRPLTTDPTRAIVDFQCGQGAPGDSSFLVPVRLAPAPGPVPVPPRARSTPRAR